MKTYLFWAALAITVGLPTPALAQGHTVCIATDRTEVCRFLDSTAAFDDCYILLEPGLFTLDAAETEFRHVTERITSHYQIKSRTYRPDDKIWEYAVLSDAGNSYVFMVCPRQSLLKVVGQITDAQGRRSHYLVAHHISRTWREPEPVGLTRH